MNWISWMVVIGVLLAFAGWFVLRRIQIYNANAAAGMDRITLFQHFEDGKLYDVSGFGILEASVSSESNRGLVSLRKPGSSGLPDDTVLVINQRGTVVGPDLRRLDLLSSGFRPVN